MYEYYYNIGIIIILRYMLPLRYDSFDNDYICGKGDSSRLTVFVLETSRNCGSSVL